MIRFFYNITGNLDISIFYAVLAYLLIIADILIYKFSNRKYCNFVLSTIIAFVAGVISGALGFTGAVAIGVCTVIGYVGAFCIYGGMALSVMNSAKSAAGGISSSATYANPTLQTQTNQDLPIPLLYGTVKLAGNRVWQDDDGKTRVKRIVGFSDGVIEDFTDIRLNDIKADTISGIKINKYYGTDTQQVDSIVGGKTQLERAEKVGSLKNLAYLAVDVPRTNDIDVNYNLTAIVKGRKIRVYTTPEKYTVKYSENPAWVMLDFLTSYNGLGLALNNDGTISDAIIKQLFDIESFIESADFCDEQIAYTNDKGEVKYGPRFTFNMIFDSQTSARNLIDEIYRSCRGGLFTKNGQLQFKIDKAEEVSKVFTANDIVKGSETYQTIPNEEHYDILKIVYVSPDHEWQKVEAFAEIPEYRDGAPIEHSVNCYSVTNFQQASRLAWYYVNSKILCPYFGSFKTDYRAFDLEVGDVIQFDSLLMGLDGYKAKVVSVIDDGAGTYTVNWRTYDERLYADTLGSYEPRVLVSNLSDIYSYPNNITGFNVVQNQKLAEFAWSAVEGVGISYEIRKGSSWDNSSLIATDIKGTSYTMSLSSKGVHNFWIKAKNKYNYSKNATNDILNVQYIPELNEVIKTDILSNPSGTFENVRINRGRLKLKPAIKWNNDGEKWRNDGIRYYADAGGKWNTQYLTSGVYTSQVYDVGASLNNIVSFDYNLFTVDDTQNITIEWRYSADNITWSDWLIGATGAYEFRYYQVRVTLNNPNGAMMYLDSLNLNVDVPDRKEDYTNREVTSAENGLRIDYATDPESKIAADFIKEKPHVLVTPYATNAYSNVVESTQKYCVVKLYTNDGNEVTGAVNISVSGY